VIAPAGTRLRCAVHPSRPAVDSCPVCGRLRCGADAAAAGEHGHGCPSCGGSSSEPRRPAAGRGPSELERYVRAALGATVAALVWGKVTSEYVGSTLFSDISPALLGVACGAAATRAAGSDGSGRTGLRVRVIACVYALLGTAFSFVDEDDYTRLELRLGVLLPYAASVAGVLLWTLPPRRSVKAAPGA
jgi:hypothetical protein